MPNESTQPSAARASRAIGAMFFTVFGAIWLMIASHLAFGRGWGVLTLIALAAIAILAAALRQYRIHRSARDAEADSPAKKRANRIFNIVNVTQWVAILVIGNVLANIGLKNWVLAAVMVIVGIHFFPLATAFGNRQLVFTGAAMIVWAIVFPFAAPGGPSDPVGCLGAGLILWSSAIASLVSKQSQ